MLLPNIAPLPCDAHPPHCIMKVNEYEVLVGDMNRLRWVPAYGNLNVASLGYYAVEGGQENNGSRLYIAEATYNNAVHPGKASEHLEGM